MVNEQTYLPNYSVTLEMMVQKPEKSIPENKPIALDKWSVTIILIIHTLYLPLDLH